MKRKHQKTLEAIFAHPVSGNNQWRDIEALFAELGADISEREGSRVAVVLFGEVRVFHRPHSITIMVISKPHQTVWRSAGVPSSAPFTKYR